MADDRRPRAVYSVGGEPDARFSMANERTALATIRTALAIVAAGIGTAALVRIDVLSDGWRAAAVALCFLGALVALGALRRWRRVERALRLDEPLPAPVMLAPTALMVAAVALVLVVLIVGFS
jgi:putative membrane protein